MTAHIYMLRAKQVDDRDSLEGNHDDANEACVRSRRQLDVYVMMRIMTAQLSCPSGQAGVQVLHASLIHI